FRSEDPIKDIAEATTDDERNRRRSHQRVALREEPHHSQTNASVTPPVNKTGPQGRIDASAEAEEDAPIIGEHQLNAPSHRSYRRRTRRTPRPALARLITGDAAQ